MLHGGLHRGIGVESQQGVPGLGFRIENVAQKHSFLPTNFINLDNKIGLGIQYRVSQQSHHGAGLVLVAATMVRATARQICCRKYATLTFPKPPSHVKGSRRKAKEVGPFGVGERALYTMAKGLIRAGQFGNCMASSPRVTFADGTEPLLESAPTSSARPTSPSPWRRSRPTAGWYRRHRRRARTRAAGPAGAW